MGKEIERRWLVPALALPRNQVERSIDIEQGYLETGSPLKSLRVRISDGTTAVVTGKTGVGIEREENEESLPVDAARMLMSYCQHAIAKTRHVIAPWEVDVFLGPLAGIVVAEFESTDRKLVMAATPPAWMPGAVEVTDSLTSLHLARMATDLEGSGKDPLAEVLASIQAPPIPRIVITGGPGSGKSTLMKLLRNHYPELQFVPEVASIVIAQVGIRPGGDAVAWSRFQRTIWRIQKIFEMTSADFAAAARKKGMVMDRGSVDNAAYLKHGLAQMERMFKTSAATEYANYDLVLDLAVPPRDVYERIKGNEPARTETYEQAVELGRAIGRVWSGHPRYVAIGYHDDLNGKVAAVVHELDKLLHDPEAAHH